MKLIAVAALLLSSFQALAAAPTSPRLEELFSRDTIGATVAYVETRIGPAWKVFDGLRTYKVDGCQVTLHTQSANVAAVTMDVSSKCNVSLEDLLGDWEPSKRPPLYQMTFGNLQEMMLAPGEFTADCLRLCGNAYDPLVYQSWSGYGANGFLDFRAGVRQVDDAALDAANRWEQTMVQQKGEDYVLDTTFNCDRLYDEQASQEFKNVPITQITLGNPSEKSNCGPF